MSAISGTRRAMKEMADGTIRVSIDIDPIHRAAFFEMFGQIDMPVALAPLVADFERRQAPIAADSGHQAPMATYEPKRGLLSQWAAMRCNEIDFRKFIRPIYDKIMGGDGSGYGDVTPDGDFDGQCDKWARHCILVICDIESRAELDSNHHAREIFDRVIRLPYIEYINSHHEQEQTPFRYPARTPHAAPI